MTSAEESPELISRESGPGVYEWLDILTAADPMFGTIDGKRADGSVPNASDVSALIARGYRTDEYRIIPAPLEGDL